MEENLTPDVGQNLENLESTETPQEPQVQADQTESIKPLSKSDYDPNWYQKDGRFGKVWKQETLANDFAKSYYNLEKEYKPIKTQFNELHKKFTSNNLDLSQIDEYIKNYTDFMRPDNPIRAKADYFSNWLDNPSYKQDVISFFEQLEKREKQRMYGDIPDERIQEIEELKAFKQKQEAEMQKQKFDGEVQSHAKTIDSQTEQNQEYAKKFGFEYDQDTHQALLKHCLDNGIDPKYIHYEFRRMVDDQAMKSLEAKIQKQTLEKVNKSKQVGAVMPSTSNKVQTTQKTGGFRDDLMKILGR